jgi:hypothetical protein
MADNKELTAPPILNPRPKTLFRSSAVKVKNHNSLISSPVLKESLDAAMMEYQYKCVGGATDANSAAAVTFKLKGALEFVDEFIRLAEPYQRPQIMSSGDKIDHTV